MAKLFDDVKQRGVLLDPTLRFYRKGEERTKGPGAKPPYCTVALSGKFIH